MKLKPIASVVMLSSLATAGAMAQTAGSEEILVLEEVIVTAQKREANSQDIAISMSVQSGEDMDNIAAFDFRELSKLAPGVEFQGTDAVSGSIKMRGVGKEPFSGGMDDSVVVFVDGVAQTSVAAAFGSLSDIERIEVLRGPQGTLYGKNAPAGAINVTTKPVNLRDLEGGFQSSWHYYDDTNTSGTNNKFHVNVPIIDGVLGARVSGFYDDSDGYVENEITGRPGNDYLRKGGRIKLQYLPTDALSFTLIGNYAENFQGRHHGYIPGFNDDFVEKTDFAAQGTPLSEDTYDSVFDGDIPRPDKDSYKVYIDTNSESSSDLADVSLTFDWDIGDHTLTSISYYQELDTVYTSDQKGTPIADGFLRVDTEQSLVTQELRLANYSNSTFDYLLGFYYSKLETEGRDGVSSTFAQVGSLVRQAGFTFRADQVTTVSGEASSESFGYFAHGTYHFNEEWALGGGIRYDDETKDAETEMRVDMVAFGIEFGFPLDALPYTEESYYNLSGSLKLMFTPTEDIMYYAAADTAYRSGGFNLSTVPPMDFISQFEPEDSEAFELGMKGQFFDNRLRWNLAWYYQTFDDYQFGDIIRQDNNDTRIFVDVDPDVPVNPITMAQSHVLNATEAVSTGVETDFTWLISNNFTLSGGLTYIDTEYKEFDAFCDSNEGPSNIMFCDYSGRSIGSNFGIAPASWVANLQPTYSDSIDSWDSEWFTRAQINYDDVRHTNFDLHAGLESYAQGWRVAVYVKNVLGRGNGEVRSNLAANSTDTYSYDLVAPRQYGITFGYQF
jgi:iron complex outermembrane recepter protein